MFFSIEAKSRTGAEFPLERVARRRLQQHHRARPVNSSPCRRGLRQARDGLVPALRIEDFTMTSISPAGIASRNEQGLERPPHAALAASDLAADLVAQSSGKRVLESRFKGLSDVALARRSG